MSRLLLSLLILIVTISGVSCGKPADSDSTPAPPVLASPENGFVTGPVLQLRWSQYEGAISYRLQISQSRQFNALDIDQHSIRENYFNITERMLWYSTYYWRVRASSVAGTSSWSEVRSFKISGQAIRVYADRVIGTIDNKLWSNIGYESLYGFTVDERLQPFWEQNRETGAIKYVRCHNLFTESISRYSQDEVKELLSAENISTELAGTHSMSSVYYGCRVYYGEDTYGVLNLDFWHLDHVFDIFLSAGIKPIVECDYMPETLAEGIPIRNYSGGLINTPNDYKKWRKIINRTVEHCIERYGVEEVRSWYWECWNEPDLRTYFIDGVPSGISPSMQQMARFLKMYDYFADAAKAADPTMYDSI